MHTFFCSLLYIYAYNRQYIHKDEHNRNWMWTIKKNDKIIISTALFERQTVVCFATKHDIVVIFLFQLWYSRIDCIFITIATFQYFNWKFLIDKRWFCFVRYKFILNINSKDRFVIVCKVLIAAKFQNGHPLIYNKSYGCVSSGIIKQSLQCNILEKIVLSSFCWKWLYVIRISQNLDDIPIKRQFWLCVNKSEITRSCCVQNKFSSWIWKQNVDDVNVF